MCTVGLGANCWHGYLVSPHTLKKAESVQTNVPNFWIMICFIEWLIWGVHFQNHTVPSVPSSCRQSSNQQPLIVLYLADDALNSYRVVAIAASYCQYLLDWKSSKLDRSSFGDTPTLMCLGLVSSIKGVLSLLIIIPFIRSYLFYSWVIPCYAFRHASDTSLLET